MSLVVMSPMELTRLDTLRRVMSGDLLVEDAATLLHLTRRQVFRLLGPLPALPERTTTSVTEPPMPLLWDSLASPILGASTLSAKR